MPSAGVQASAAIIRLARELRTALDQRFAPLGLTSQQAGLLIHVFTGQTAAKQLAELLGTDSAGVTRLLDRLEAKGYLARSPDGSDRRAIQVALTVAGRALLPQQPGGFEDVAEDLLRGMQPDRVAGVIDAMLENLRDQDASSPP
jgi:DNA-binding MarR family transcriptional regulator